jgi:thioredoxin-related protein
MRQALPTLILCLAFATMASAQEQVHWRYHYQAARQEALQKRLPLFLDFSTEWCTYCKKLDVTTFRDPTVVKLLNTHFIPVKLDGTREQKLVDALQIQAYPTLVIADAEGKILKNITGFVDAARMVPQLQEAVTATANPDWMMAAYQEARTAVAAGQTAKAIAILKPFLDDPQPRPIQVPAQKLMEEIEQYGRQLLAHAKQRVDQADYAAALQIYTHISNQFTGLTLAKEAAQLHTALLARPEVSIQQRKTKAAELLAQAKKDYADKLDLSCLERCTVLQTQYADLPEATEAGQLLEQLRATPERLQAMSDLLTTRLGETLTLQAQRLIDRGEPELAVITLERIITMLPESAYAVSAKKKLAVLKFKTSTPK